MAGADAALGRDEEYDEEEDAEKYCPLPPLACEYAGHGGICPFETTFRVTVAFPVMKTKDGTSLSAST